MLISLLHREYSSFVMLAYLWHSLGRGIMDLIVIST